MNRRALLSWLGWVVAAGLLGAGALGLVTAGPDPRSLLNAFLRWLGMSWQTMASALAIAAGAIIWLFLRLRGENARLEAVVAARARELKASEEKFRGIFEHSPEGIFQSTPEGRNLTANPAMARLCGYRSPEELRAALTDLETQFYVQPGRRREINARLETEGALVGLESEIRRKDGSTLWISENVRLVRDPATDSVIYLGSIVDVSQKRQDQRRLREAMRAAESASSAKSAFLAHMSHELRTPLNAILGYARLLLREPEFDAATRERLGVIAKSGEHLLGLINEVLDLYKIEAGKVELQPVAFHLPGLLMELADAFRPRAAEKNLALSYAGSPALPQMVRADESKLRQVLFNLLGNAVKFTDRGRIELRASRRAGGGGTVWFEVEDTGIGIAPGQQRAIFLPFHQGADTARAAQGTGLGLSISQRLVELMGGELRVESTPGVGSRFFFELDLPELPVPAASPAADAARRTRLRTTGYRGPRRRVLIVDDAAVNRAILRDLLAPLGFEVSEAAGGAEALEGFAALAPDLVLLDLLMAPPDGFETARRLRRTPAGRAARIIACSASVFPQTQQEALDAGCDEFAPKPLDESRLLDAVARLLGLEWILPNDGQDGRCAPTSLAKGSLARGEIDALLALALAGDVVKIRARLRELAAAARGTDPFLHKLETLAAAFQLERLTRALEQAREGASAS